MKTTSVFVSVALLAAAAHTASAAPASDLAQRIGDSTVIPAHLPFRIGVTDPRYINHGQFQPLAAQMPTAELKARQFGHPDGGFQGGSHDMHGAFGGGPPGGFGGPHGGPPSGFRGPHGDHAGFGAGPHGGFGGPGGPMPQRRAPGGFDKNAGGPLPVGVPGPGGPGGPVGPDGHPPAPGQQHEGPGAVRPPGEPHGGPSAYHPAMDASFGGPGPARPHGLAPPPQAPGLSQRAVEVFERRRSEERHQHRQKGSRDGRFERHEGIQMGGAAHGGWQEHDAMTGGFGGHAAHDGRFGGGIPGAAGGFSGHGGMGMRPADA